jgi:ribokinase
VEKCTWLDHRNKLNKLFVIGNACRDVTYRVATLPRPGETALALGTAADLGGKGFNQAIAARRTGQAVHFIAAVGSDVIAENIIARLKLEGINADGLVVHDGPSDSSIVLVDEAGENLIVSSTSRAEALAFRAVFKPGDTLLLQGSLSRETTRAAAAAAKMAVATVVLNAAPFRDWLPDLAPFIDILIVNELELYQWAGREVTQSLDNVIHAAHVNTVVTTLGSKGCRVRLASGEIFNIATPQTPVIDTTGAGDVFTGTYTSEWMAYRNHRHAATLAVHVASDKVRRFGSSTAFPSAETIDLLRKQILTDQPPPHTM